MATLRARILEELGAKPTIDPAGEVRARVDFLKSYLRSTPAKGFVLGISGGAIRRCFSGRPGSAVLQRWGLATVLTALAVRLALMSRPV